MKSNYVVELSQAGIYHTDDPFAQLTARNCERIGERVLSDVSLQIGRGEFVYFVGRVGSGKSSLLKILYAELPLVEGDGCVAGFDLRTMKRGRIPYLRRKIGIVFQDVQLLTDRDVEQNLCYVLRATGWHNEAEIQERIAHVLHDVGLEGKNNKMPFELSGGEGQRLMIARALLNSPELILADEPTGNLDPVTADGIIKLFQAIAAKGTTVVMSTHNTSFIERYPSRTILFANGAVKEVDLTTLLAAKR